MVTKLKEQKSLLSAALKDLNQELSRLKLLKTKLERNSQTTRTSVGTTQAKELKLRNELTALIAQEEKLVKKKELLEKKINDLKGKIEKVSKISRDLGAV